MIEVTTIVPRKFLEGKPLVNGRAVFDDDEIEASTLEMFKNNPTFTVRKVGDGTNIIPVKKLSLEEAISGAVRILNPALKEHGLPEGDFREHIRGAFIKRKVDKVPPALSPDDEMQAVVNACLEIVGEQPIDDNKFAGEKPRAKALSEIVGFAVSGKLRDDAWELHLRSKQAVLTIPGKE